MKIVYYKNFRFIFSNLTTNFFKVLSPDSKKIKSFFYQLFSKVDRPTEPVVA